jgi:hypothetical protein
MRAFAIGVLWVAAGCAAPFTILPGKAGGGLTVACCGARTTSVGAMVQAVDEIPVGPSGGPLPSPEQLHLCLEVVNRGAAPVTVDRSHLHLSAPRERQPWIPDADPEEVTLAPGQARRFQVAFEYTPIAAGERLSVDFSGALDRGKVGPTLTLVRQGANPH